MAPAKKEKSTIRIRQGYDAMSRLGEAGELIGELLNSEFFDDRSNSEPTFDAVTCAFMDFILETIEIGHELVNRESPETVKSWIEPKRDVLLAELQKRGLDQSADALDAFRKIDAVLSWVDNWSRQRKRAKTPEGGG